MLTLKRTREGALLSLLMAAALPGGRTAEGLANKGAWVPLKYVANPTGPPIWTHGQSMAHSNQPLRALKLPRFTSTKPQFLQARLGDASDNRYDFALDESVPGRGYDLLYVDANHNQDLTGEPPIHARVFSLGKGFGPIEMQIQAGGHALNCRIVVSLAGNISAYQLHAWGYCEGIVSIAGSNYSALVLDNNGNGLIDDASTAPWGIGDLLCVDLDRDGVYRVGDLAGEVLPVGRHVIIGGKFYDLNVARDATGLSLAPTEARMVRLGSKEGDFRLELRSREGSFWIDSLSGVAELPAADYTLLHWSVMRNDNKGISWSASGHMGRLRKLPVIDDGTILPRLTEPVRADVSYLGKGKDGLEFGLVLQPAIGDRFVFFFREGKQVPPPHLRIVDSSGKAVAKTQFHYG